MQKNWKNLLTIAMMAIAASGVMVACDDDDDDDNTPTGWTAQDVAISTAAISGNYVDNVVVPTYKALKDDAKSLMDAVEDFVKNPSASTIANVDKYWKSARKNWEYSEAFLYGAASGYGIDPHIDTWPFDKAMYNNVMSKYDLTKDEDKETVVHLVQTSQNFTGFHALEYVIYENGAVKTNPESLTANELIFCTAVAEDLYVNAIRLYGAWAGEDALSADEKEVCEDAEIEFPDNFGEEMKNAGYAGSRWKTPTAALVQIIDGCNSILDEVSAAKIGTAANAKVGSDDYEESIDYIESPYSYNSITDFVDNTLGCAHALYGTMDITISDVEGGNIASKLSAATGSLMAYAALTHTEKEADVASKLATALTKVAAMKRPFVSNYTDPSAQDAMDALDELVKSLSTLSSAISAQ